MPRRKFVSGEDLARLASGFRRTAMHPLAHDQGEAAPNANGPFDRETASTVVKGVLARMNPQDRIQFIQTDLQDIIAHYGNAGGEGNGEDRRRARDATFTGRPRVGGAEDAALQARQKVLAREDLLRKFPDMAKVKTGW